jgi:hypothetical protein
MENDIEQSNSPQKRFAPEDARTESSEQARRDALKKMGKYIIYAAPALLAMTSEVKAQLCVSTAC